MRALLCLLPLLLLAACGGNTAPPGGAAPETVIPFRQDGTLDFLREGQAYLTVAIEIAETDSARTRGLMQRTSLPERSGMLFLFDSEQPQGFWMANTPMALDLLFIDADSQIVDIARYTKPLSPETVSSKAPARFVLEVPAGFSDSHGITETDRVRWRRTGSDG